ncbi:hypothetical protein FQR65_LT09358 [Abscondita terminalis]|nr:hypothetical protein FQR65_LT09358 [Abscondita terminalis]
MFKGKFALVTGGGGGLGLEYVKELLRNGIQGVTILDINKKVGIEVEENLRKEYGHSRVLFVPTDVAQSNQLKDAFATSFRHWNGLDIVINNAGIANEQEWDKAISLNCSGTADGTYLGFEYMSKLKSKNGGVIVNVSSIAGTEAVFFLPTYSATKSFVLAFSRGLGNKYYYDTHGIKVFTVCPGLTVTPILSDLVDKSFYTLNPGLDILSKEFLSTVKMQPASYVAKHVIKLIDTAESGSAWVIEEEEPPYQIYEHTKSVLRNKP